MEPDGAEVIAQNKQNTTATFSSQTWKIETEEINVCTLGLIHSVIEFGLRRMRRTTTVSPTYFVLIDLCSSCHTVKVKRLFSLLFLLIYGTLAGQGVKIQYEYTCTAALPPNTSHYSSRKWGYSVHPTHPVTWQMSCSHTRTTFHSLQSKKIYKDLWFLPVYVLYPLFYSITWRL